MLVAKYPAENTLPLHDVNPGRVDIWAGTPSIRIRRFPPLALQLLPSIRGFCFKDHGGRRDTRRA